MQFGSIGPELINGRLAMWAWFCCWTTEVTTGQTAWEQFASDPLSVFITIAAVSAGTFAPKIRGGDMNPEVGWEKLYGGDKSEVLDVNELKNRWPLISPAFLERWNGRAAMIGLASLIVIEIFSGKPLF